MTHLARRCSSPPSSCSASRLRGFWKQRLASASAAFSAHRVDGAWRSTCPATPGCRDADLRPEDVSRQDPDAWGGRGRGLLVAGRRAASAWGDASGRVCGMSGTAGARTSRQLGAGAGGPWAAARTGERGSFMSDVKRRHGGNSALSLLRRRGTHLSLRARAAFASKKDFEAAIKAGRPARQATA